MTDQNRERFEAWWYGWNGVRTRYAHYTFLGVSEESAKDIWQAATSARPTAQGVQALADEAKRQMQEMGRCMMTNCARRPDCPGICAAHTAAHAAIDALAQAGSAPEARVPLPDWKIDDLARENGDESDKEPDREADYALIEKHLGLRKYRKDCVINNSTGRWTDAKRYFDMLDEARAAAELGRSTPGTASGSGEAGRASSGGEGGV